MKKILLIPVLLATLAGCTQTERAAVIGAGTGAAIGSAVGGNLQGALAGAAIGGIAGALIGHAHNRPGYCVYRDRYNRRYTARCRSN